MGGRQRARPAFAVGADAGPLPLARAIAIVAGLGVTSGYALALPSGADGVFTASYFPDDPKAERTIYLDQYSGAVLKDIRYDDYGAVSRAVSYGTSLHMGRYFAANQIVCAALSLGNRRDGRHGHRDVVEAPPGSQAGAPSRERGAPPMRGWIAGLVLLGIVFPLMGATIVAVWLIDRLLFGRAARAAPDSSRAGIRRAPGKPGPPRGSGCSLVLALVAPLISQLRCRTDDGLPAAPICSATANTLVAHAQSQASPDSSSDSSSDSPSDRHFDRCGYCGLLAGHPPLQSAVLLSASPAVRHRRPRR